VSTVFPDETLSIAPEGKKEKAKKKKSVAKKKSSSAAVKKTPKLKRGESKVPLTMEDLYLKENPFNIPNVDRNVASSAKYLKDTDVKASSEGKFVTPSERVSTAEKAPILEKGNTDETLKVVDKNSDKNPRVVNKNAVSSNACDTPDVGATNMDGNPTFDETVKIPDEKQDVGPDVEISLGQQVIEQDDEPSPNQEEVVLEKSTDNVEHNAEVHINEEQSKSDESGRVGNQEETDTVDLEVEESPEVPQSKTQCPSIAKRLRSSTCKISLTPTNTPMTRMKSVVVEPKKGWSKVTHKVTSEKKSKKRKMVETSDSEY
jgi:hypothetical protein